jgi:hypothetical protein
VHRTCALLFKRIGEDEADIDYTGKGFALLGIGVGRAHGEKIATAGKAGAEAGSVRRPVQLFELVPTLVEKEGV